MINRSVLALNFIVMAALFLSGCVGFSSPQRNPNAGRYAMQNDVSTLEPIDLSQLAPVIPVVEPRTRAGNSSPYTINGRTYYVRESEAGYLEEGGASWYGRKFHGHLTSNGETYDMFQVTAAHKTLPIPSYARVTNLQNGKEIIVRINDRGPFHEGRIIDLSYAAAASLGYAATGTAQVRVEAIVPPQQTIVQAAPAMNSVITTSEIGDSSLSELLPADEMEALNYLQIAAYSSEASALSLLSRVVAITDVPAFIRTDAASGNGGESLHRVRLGPIDSPTDLDALIKVITEANLGMPFRVSQ